MKSIRLLRSVFGIKLERLAQRSGVSRREVHRVETGAVVPQLGTVLALDKAIVELVNERRLFKKEARAT